MRFCITCAHHSAGECNATQNLGEINLVTGERSRRYTCEQMRSSTANAYSCGADAIWWQPIPVEPTPKRRGRPPKAKND